MTQELLDGFQHYCRENDALMRELTRNGQRPEYFIISCMDSRSNPGIIFRMKPGAYFPHSPIGAIVRPHQQGTALSASLELALNDFGVRQIIIMGHTGCAAMKALVNGTPRPETASFLKVAEAALERARARCSNDNSPDILEIAAEETVLLGAENLQTYPDVRKAMDDGLIIHRWMFDMHRHAIKAFNQASGAFEPLIECNEHFHFDHGPHSDHPGAAP